MFVKPRETTAAERADGWPDHLIVRDPAALRRVLPPTGGNVPDNQYWQLRLRDGDVIPASPTEAQPAPAQQE
jgi:hypothetical protein